MYGGIDKRSEDTLNVLPLDSTDYRCIEGLGTGDSSMHYNIIPPRDVDIFDSLMKEVNFGNMTQSGGVVPRLVCIQGILTPNGLEPIYRHPTDSMLQLYSMSPTVLEIKRELELRLNNDKIFNHVLIQLYRNGADFINEHTDKTLDIQRGTSIVNYSVGSARTFFLKLKTDSIYKGNVQSHQKIVLPNNSAFQCSWSTNAHFVHGIRHDNRPDSSKHSNEIAHSGMRISLTFRTIATYVYRSPTSGFIQLFGQGAKSKDVPSEIISENDVNSEEDEKVESLRLLSAFSKENHHSDFDWDSYYGEGFNITRIRINSESSIPLNS